LNKDCNACHEVDNERFSNEKIEKPTAKFGCAAWISKSAFSSCALIYYRESHK
jgi:hypothetical protein